jgi:hypothetical protein
MNFLNIAQTVRSLAGIQGTGPTSVVDAQGIEAVIVQFVKDANIDIQNLRDDFEFMEASSSFTTVVGQDTYTRTALFTPASPDVNKFKIGSFVVTDLTGKKHYLLHYEFLEEMERLYLNDITQGIPRYVGITADRSLYIKQTPDNNYVITYKYYRNPQILSANADIPWIPEAYHMLLVYKALEKVAVYLSQPEIYRGYATEAARAQAQLMRLSVPKKRIQTRPLV